MVVVSPAEVPAADQTDVYDGVMILHNVMVRVRDGTRLATDVYLPTKDGRPVSGRWPALLQRSPYGKWRDKMIQPSEYFCKRGYAVVLQDCRGRNDSEGEYYHIRNNEAQDGYDTVEWVAAQPWCDGQVGTWGWSYSSVDQGALASQNPPHLKAMLPMVGGHNLYIYGWRHAGAVNLKIITVGFWMAATSKEAAANPAIKNALEQADVRRWLKQLPLKLGASPLALVPSYEKWVYEYYTQPDYGPFWENPDINFQPYYDQFSDVPTLLVTGWYDSWPWNMCEMYTALSTRKRGPIRLVIGPWTHQGMSVTYSGDVDFGAVSTVDGNLADSYYDWMARWFDQWLRRVDNGVADEPTVKLFIMGGGSGHKNAAGRLDHGGYWRDEHEWPLARTQYTNYYLRSGGDLSTERPPAGERPSRYLHDPDHPVPTVASNGSGITEIVSMPEGISNEPVSVMLRQRPLIIEGAAHQAERPGAFGCEPPYPTLGSRGDVVVFETAPLTQDIEVTGPVIVNLWASSSALDTDFTAKLLDIYPASLDYPDGYHMNLCEGMIRARYRDYTWKPTLLKPGEIYEFKIDLDPTGNVFRAGHRIRVDISSSNYGKWDVNPGTGEPLGHHTHSIVAENTVYHDADHPSHIVLPVIPA